MSQRDSRLVGGVYRIGPVMTSGGILTTCTAYNRNTNDVVGLIVIETPPGIDARAIQRVLLPLERRRSLDSPHVIHVYDWGVDGSRMYIATDPPRGMTLRYVLDNENIDFQRALDFLRQMTLGVKVLHERGITGIDLRPQLVTVDSVVVEDRIQLDDVGLRTMLKELGYIAGDRPDDIGFLDPRYASPEHINNGPVGPWSDIYQLGLLFFELVTGRLPFVGRNSAETGVLQSTAPIPRMAQFKHDTPASLQEIVDRTLAKNPAMRYGSAAELLAALDAAKLPGPRVPVNLQADKGPTTNPYLKDTLQQPAAGMTREMQEVQKDAAQQATLIGSLPSTPSSQSAPAQASSEIASAYAFLCYEKDGMEIQRFAISKKDAIVGRSDPKRGLSPDIDLTPLDPNMTVSRQHARIRYEETFFYIEDLKSRNKTRLGELPLVPLKPELLQHGDILHFGAVRLVFKLPGLPDKPIFKEHKA